MTVPFERSFDGGERRASRQDIVHKKAHGSLSEGPRPSSRHADGAGQVPPARPSAHAHLVPPRARAAERGHDPCLDVRGAQAVRYRTGQDHDGLPAACPSSGTCRRNGDDGQPGATERGQEGGSHAAGRIAHGGYEEPVEVGPSAVLPVHDEVSHRPYVGRQRPHRDRWDAVEPVQPGRTELRACGRAGEQLRAARAPPHVELTARACDGEQQAGEAADGMHGDHSRRDGPLPSAVHSHVSGSRHHGTVQQISLTLDQARRIAIAAQGLHRPRADGPRTMRHLQGVIDRLGLLQIDSVNVLARAHQLPLFSRLGPYSTDLLDRATTSGAYAAPSTRGAAADRRLVESWAHVAAYVPPHTWPLLGFRRRWFAQEHDWGELDGVRLPDAPQVQEVRDLVAAEGPLSASQIHDRFVSEGRAVRRRRGTWWDRTTEKRAVEHLFLTGEVVSVGRNKQFERLYDLPERVLPPSALVDVPEPAAKRALLELGAKAHGIGTARCIKDYYRLRGPVADQALAELVQDGVLLPARVAGGSEQWFVHRDAARPRRTSGQALLAPFDPLVWERTRLERLFGMRYRIGIYTPAAQRVDGYYVLPFLEDAQLTARVDLKADRAAGVLRVQSAGAEASVTDETPARLAAELGAMARWLGLDGVVVESRGTLSPALRSVTVPA